MSKLGDNVDRVLELLKDGKTFHLGNFEKDVHPAYHEILNFMHECGLIDIEKGDIIITGFGLALLNLEQSL